MDHQLNITIDPRKAVLNLSTRHQILRDGVEAAARDIEREAAALPEDSANAVQSIAFGLRLLLAQTTTGEAVAAAMIPEDTPALTIGDVVCNPEHSALFGQMLGTPAEDTPAAAETRPCETSDEEEAQTDGTSAG